MCRFLKSSVLREHRVATQHTVRPRRNDDVRCEIAEHPSVTSIHRVVSSIFSRWRGRGETRYHRVRVDQKRDQASHDHLRGRRNSRFLNSIKVFEYVRDCCNHVQTREHEF